MGDIQGVVIGTGKTLGHPAHRLSPDCLSGHLSHLSPCDGLDVRGETFLQPMMIFSHLREYEMHHLVA